MSSCEPTNDLIVVIQVIAPSWRARIQFDVDGYATKAQAHLKACLGWTVETVQSHCKEHGYHQEKRIIPIACP